MAVIIMTRLEYCEELKKELTLLIRHKYLTEPIINLEDTCTNHISFEIHCGEKEFNLFLMIKENEIIKDENYLTKLSETSGRIMKSIVFEFEDGNID
jgi:hypothetical protein